MKLGENKLKVKLMKVRENNYLLEKEESYYEIGLEMMNSIGVLDAELRDKLIYTTFYHWIIEDKFNTEQLRQLLSISTSNSHLFNRLNEKHGDGVFKRTFSVLIIALIVYKHRNEKFLTKEELQDVRHKVIDYMIREEDLRGYVEGQGWAHASAHTADALDELIQCDCFSKNDVKEILDSIKAKVCIGYYVYIDEEDERIVNVVESCIRGKILNNSEILSWLKAFKIQDYSNKNIEFYHLKVNIKGFLRSLYFRLANVEGTEMILKEIKSNLDSL